MNIDRISTTIITTIASTLTRSVTVAQIKSALKTNAPIPITAVSTIKRQSASTDCMAVQKARRRSVVTGVCVVGHVRRCRDLYVVGKRLSLAHPIEESHALPSSEMS